MSVLAGLVSEGGGFAVARVGLGSLLLDDEGRDQRGSDAKGRADEVAIMEAVDRGGGYLLLGRSRHQVQVGHVMCGAGSSNSSQHG